MFLIYMSQKWRGSAFACFDAGVILCLVLVHLVLCALMVSA